MTIKTTIHAYQYNLNDELDALAYDKLRERLKAEKYPHKMHAIGDYAKLGQKIIAHTNNGAIELETTHLFANQWNTAPIAGLSDNGFRVFDWAEDAIFSNRGELTHLKYGHYLTQTAEMREIRRNTNACGYCGYQEPAAKGSVFCPMCLDSEYLKESEIYLTRMIAVEQNDHRSVRAPLTPAETAHLLPKYLDAQIHGSSERGRRRIAKRRTDLEKKYQQITRAAKAEHDGLLWLLDRGINTENVIYYSHTEKFSFGWRKPLSAAERDALLNVISEFPYAYELKCDDGKSLEGY